GFFTVAVSVFTTRVSRSWAAENEKAEVTRVSMKKFLRIIKFYIWLKIENYTKTVGQHSVSVTAVICAPAVRYFPHDGFAGTYPPAGSLPGGTDPSSKQDRGP